MSELTKKLREAAEKGDLVIESDTILALCDMADAAEVLLRGEADGFWNISNAEPFETAWQEAHDALARLREKLDA